MGLRYRENISYEILECLYEQNILRSRIKKLVLKFNFLTAHIQFEFDNVLKPSRPVSSLSQVVLSKVICWARCGVRCNFRFHHSTT